MAPVGRGGQVAAPPQMRPPMMGPPPGMMHGMPPGMPPAIGRGTMPMRPPPPRGNNF